MNGLTHHHLWRFVKVLCLYLIIVIGLFSVLFSSIPQVSAEPTYTINYQGKLTDTSGLAVADGTYNMRFWLTQSTGQATTSAVWTESRTGGNKVTVENGLFSVQLGSVSSLASVNFNQTLYLGLEIGGSGSPTWDGEMLPRKIIGTVPSAFEAKQLGGVASTSFLRSDQADSASGLLTFTGGLISSASSTVSRLSFLNATGTSLYMGGDRITDFTGTNLEVVGNSLGLSSTYLGQASITTLGTITTGVWNGTAIGASYLDASLLLATELDTCAEFAALGTIETGTCGSLVLSVSPAITGTLDVEASDFSGTMTLSGTAANIALGSNFLSGDGDDEGIYVTSVGRVGIGTTTPNQVLTVQGNINLSSAAGAIYFDDTKFLYASTTNDSVVFGESAGNGFTFNHTENVAIGYLAAQLATNTNVDNGVFIGSLAGYSSSGASNTFVGSNAGRTNSGSFGSFYGASAGYANTGAGNVLLGNSSGFNNTGSDNVFLSRDAGYNNTGDRNSFIGYQTGYVNNGDYNEFVGYQAGRYLQATSSVVIGGQALYGNHATTYISLNNVALGYRAGYASNDGSGQNILLGYQAADNLTTGNNNIIIGYDIDSPTATADNILNIGNIIFGTGIDASGTTVDANATIGIGTSTPWKRFSVSGDMVLTGALFDASGDAGTSGQVLLSTVTGTNWVATSSLGITSGASSLEALTDVGSMTENYGDLLYWTGSEWNDIATSSLGLLSAGNNSITPNNIKTAGQTDEYCLTYETGGTFEWQTCGAGGSTFLSMTDVPDAYVDQAVFFSSGGQTFFDADFKFSSSTNRLTVGTATFGTTGFSFSGAATSTIVNNNAYAFTIATSSTAHPLFRIDTTAGAESVSIGTVGGDVYIGGIGSASDLIFEESSTISGQGTNTLTLGVAGDNINVAAGASFKIATTTASGVFTVASSTTSTLLSFKQFGTGDILNIFDGNTEVFTILDGGKVGIASSTPWQELSVNGDIALTGRIYDSLASAGTNGMVLQTTGSATRWVATSSLGIAVSEATIEGYIFDGDNGGTLSSGTLALDSLSYSGTVDDTYVNDAITVTGGTLGSNNISGTLTTTAGLTIGDGGDTITISATNWGVNSSGVFTGVWNGGAIGIAYGGLGAAFTDPNADQLMFWDDSAGAITGISTLSGAAISGTTLTINDVTCTDCLTSTEIADEYVFNTGDSISGNLSFSGSTANIALGSNWLSGDGDDEGISVSSIGNVGIGTTTPDSLLTLQSTSNPVFKISSPWTSGAYGEITFESNGVGFGTRSGIRGTTPGDATRGLSFFTSGSANSVKMSILGNGNVGIGTTTPSSKLAVLSTTEQLRLNYSSTQYWSDTIASDGGRTLAGFGTDADLNFTFGGATDGDFSINTDDLFVDTSTGNVGVGTVSPAAMFSVQTNTFLVNGTGSPSGIIASSTYGVTRFNTQSEGVTGGSLPVSFLNYLPSSYGTIGNANRNSYNTWFAGGGGHSNFPVQTVTGSPSIYARMRLDSDTFTAASAQTIATGATLYIGSAPANGTNVTVTNPFALYVNSGNSYFAGSVGVGSTSPSAKLTLQNTGSGNSFIVEDQSADTSPFIIDASGNVGIGTASPSYPLHVASGAVFAPSGFIVSTGSSGTGLYNGSVVVRGDNAGNYSFIDFDGVTQRMSLNNIGNDGVQIETTAGITLTVNGSGKVGIGTTTPASKLNVLSTTEQLRLAYSQTQYWSDTIASDGGRTLAGFGTDADLNFTFAGATDGDFSVNTDDLFVDTSTGKVGVGTTTPWKTFSVAGDAVITGALFDSTASAGGSGECLKSTVTGTDWGTCASGFLASADIDTSSELAAILTDETGSAGGGLAVFSLSPTITGTADFVAGDFSSTLTMSGSAANIALGSNWLSGDGGDEGVFVNSSGNVGIGTSSPAYNLDVQGASVTSFRLQQAGNNDQFLVRVGSQSLGYSETYLTGQGYKLAMYANPQSSSQAGSGSITYPAESTGIISSSFAPLVLGAGASEKMRILTNGNVGIGTTTANQALSIFRSAADSAIEFSSLTGAPYKWTAGIDYSDGGKFKISSSSALGTNDRFVIDGSGNVGIGTSNPTRALEVVSGVTGQAGIRVSTDGTATRNAFEAYGINNGSYVLDCVNCNNAPTINLASGNSAGGVINLTTNTRTWKIQSSTNDLNFVDNTSFGNVITLKGTSGNVGIGTTTANQALSIFRSAADSAIEFSSFTGSPYKWTVGIDYSDAGKFKISSSSALGTNDRFVIDGSGRVGIGTSNPNSVLSLYGPTGSFGQLVVTDSVSAASGGIYVNGNATWLQSNTSSGIIAMAAYGTAGNVVAFPSGGVAIGKQYSWTGYDPGADNLYVHGKVGIGTTTPNQKLTVQGNINLSANDGAIYFDDSRTIYASSTNYSVAFGQNALVNSIAAYANTALGVEALRYATSSSAYSNVAVGYRSMLGVSTNFSASNNTAVGVRSLTSITTGDANTAIGLNSMQFTTIGSDNTALGYYALGGNGSGANNVAIGREAASFDNLSNTTAVGYQAGISMTGSNNILLGYKAGDSLSSGANNIIIGYDVENVTNSASNRLNIGNLIFGTGIDGTGTTLSSGNIGIGTSSPYARLSISDPGGSVPLLLVTKSGSPTIPPLFVNDSNISFGTFSTTNYITVNGSQGGLDITESDSTTSIGLRLSSDSDEGFLTIYNSSFQSISLSGAGESVFNDRGLSTADFRIEGDTDANLFFADVSADRIGIGTTTPWKTFSVAGDAVITGALFDSIASAGGSGECLKSTVTGTDWGTCGAGGGLASTDIDTSSELSTILTDETGTGRSVFSISPAFSGTPTFAALTATSTLAMSGTAANIALGSNFISNGGADEGISVGASGNVTISGTLGITGGLTIDATSETNIEAAIDTLSNLTSASALATVGSITSGTWQGTVIDITRGGLGAAFTDPNADQLMFWDDSAAKVTGISILTGAAISGTTLTINDVTCTDCLTSTEIADEYLFNTGDSISGNLTFSGSTANIALGSNYLSNDGDDEGISVDTSGNVNALQDQFAVCSGGACASTANGDGTITAERAITSEESSLTAGSGIALNWDNGNQQYLSLTTNSTIGSFSNNTTGQTLRLVVCQDGTGGRTFTFSPTIKWAGATTPTQTSTANKCDVYSFIQTTAGTLGSFNQNF